MTQSAGIYSVAQIREIEQLSISKFSIAQTTLMQCAGAAALSVLQEHWPQARRIAVLCGSGNNGGDGYVLARLAYAHGVDVTVYTIGETDTLQGGALEAAQACNEVNVPVKDFALFDARVDVIVDAILGIGISGEVRAEVAAVIELVNASDAPVLAIDVPSGLCADTGSQLGQAIIAHATVTMIGMKKGLLTNTAVDYCGQLHVERLQIPELVFDHVQPEVEGIEFEQYHDLFGLRRKNCHKGSFGHVLIVGGAPGYSGAAFIAAEAAARVGSGLVSVAYHHQDANCMSHRRPEIIAHAVADAKALQPLLMQADVVVIGPGLGANAWGKSLLRAVLACDKPTLLDADALNIIADMEPCNLSHAIMTPHPGEAARLLGCKTHDIQANRFLAAESLQEKYQAICVLKGAGTIIADNEGLALCAQGNPGMASGGMGDLLSGLIGGLLAQHVDPHMAAKIGVCLHAHAADITAEDVGERGLLALDLIPAVMELINP